VIDLSNILAEIPVVLQARILDAQGLVMELPW
jgi:hypothetical protein